MTAPKRVSVKLFVENPQDVETDAVVPVFQRWIQQHTVEGLLIDVADYKHVFQGPGIILIAHEGDYAYTLSDARPGIQYTLKNTEADTLNEALAISIRRAVDAAEKFQADEALSATVNFSEVQISLVDRLNYPNNEETIALVEPLVQAMASALFDGDVSVEVGEGDKRNLLTFVLKAEAPIQVSDVATRLSTVQA